MQRANIKLGGFYYCKVSNKIVVVKVVQLPVDGKITVINQDTDRTLYLKNARRLRSEVRF